MDKRFPVLATVNNAAMNIGVHVSCIQQLSATDINKPKWERGINQTNSSKIIQILKVTFILSYFLIPLYYEVALLCSTIVSIEK